MSRESYARGFCKVAEAAGVDPTALVKYAQQAFKGVPAGPNWINAAIDKGVSAAKNPLAVNKVLDAFALAGGMPSASKDLNRYLAFKNLKDIFARSKGNPGTAIRMASGLLEKEPIAGVAKDILKVN